VSSGDKPPKPGNIVPLIPAGKVMCYVTGVLRRDTPEENVRQRWARSLIDEYGYSRSDMALEFKVKMGTASKKADIVIFKPGAPKKQENILIIVESKRSDVLPRAKNEGVEQLKSYMAACSGCRFGLWVGSEKLAYEKQADGTLADLVDLPVQGESEGRVPTFSDLVPAVDLKATLRRCHNYIYVNQGLQKAEAFHEVLKLIFCKVYDETESAGALKFYIRNEERRSEAGQRRVLTERIEPLFAAVKERYPYIFKATENVELNRRVLAYIVGELQKYTLLRTNTDVKGEAYEELVGANLRGDRGEYFTPRNVCDMTVRMVLSTFQRQRLSTLRILDLCCGTGGFLVSAVNQLREYIKAVEAVRGGSEQAISSRVSARIRELASLNLYGLDINPLLVKTCQMNLVMHGDGSANVFQADSLASPAEWDNAEATSKVPHGKFDIVVTNPPFGGKAQVDDPHILSRYELTSYGVRDPRSLLPAEQLFVEGAMKFLKPGGRLAIVLPDSILNNPSLEFIRQWLFLKSRVIATVDLPKETFADSGGVPNPSVLVVQKLTREEATLAEANALPDYPVFMGIPKTAGRDKRGNPIYYKTPEGLEVLDENMRPILDDEIPAIADFFADWVKEVGHVSA
jgi:type I restriction enzyme M protein